MAPPEKPNNSDSCQLTMAPPFFYLHWCQDILHTWKYFANTSISAIRVQFACWGTILCGISSCNCSIGRCTRLLRIRRWWLLRIRWCWLLRISTTVARCFSCATYTSFSCFWCTVWKFPLCCASCLFDVVIALCCFIPESNPALYVSTIHFRYKAAFTYHPGGSWGGGPWFICFVKKL